MNNSGIRSLTNELERGCVEGGRKKEGKKNGCFRALIHALACFVLRTLKIRCCDSKTCGIAREKIIIYV